MPFYQLSTDVPVDRSAYSSDMELGIIEDNDSLREDDSDLFVRPFLDPDFFAWVVYLLS